MGNLKYPFKKFLALSENLDFTFVFSWVSLDLAAALSFSMVGEVVSTKTDSELKLLISIEEKKANS